MKIGRQPMATAVVMVISTLVYYPQTEIHAFTTQTPTPTIFGSHKIIVREDARNFGSAPLRAKNNNAVSDNDTVTSTDTPTSISQAAHSTIRQCLALSSILFAVILSPTTPTSHPTPTSFLHPHPPSALAADYTSLTPEQKAVAEAWRIVDGSFFDRTFNGQDWFSIRQDAVKKKYKSMDEAQKAVERLVGTLGDKYTRYLPPSKYRSIVDAATGTLAGVGVQIGVETVDGGNRVFVADLEPNSPASIGGIQRSDTFLEVDGIIMNDGKSTPDDVAAKLRGPASSKVGIVVDRSGKKLDFILTRKPITITSVRQYISTAPKKDVGKVGVIRIKSFSGTTAATVAEAMDDLKGKGAQALVLDVHGNPGGLLPGGTDTASLFLNVDLPLVFVVDKKGVIDAQKTLNTGKDVGVPLVIFTDKNTASAAEVMTAALKENGRATVVGKKTFGKGIIQTIRQLAEDNGGVAITVARYETPLHNDINKNGIDVDFDVDCDDEDVAVCVPPSAFKTP